MPDFSGYEELESGSVCPCGSGRPFGGCCQPLLNCERLAATARELMRSRYTAHALNDRHYLHRTHLRTAKKPFVLGPAREPRVRWHRLVIHVDEPGSAPDLWYVEFSAYYSDDDGAHEMRERSQFRRVDGEWLYARRM